MRFRAWRVMWLPAVLAFVAILGAAVMLLWNAVVLALFDGARPLDYAHAIGLLVLCRILFGGFRGRGGWRRHGRLEKWAAMTPEERAQFCSSRSAPFEQRTTAP